MKKNKVVLPLIIVLLLVFIPCSIYGIYNKVLFTKERGNPNHLHKFENQLFFYNASDELLGVYECKNENCNDARPIIDDEYLRHYEGAQSDVGLFGGEYAFIQDGDIVKLHNVRAEKTIAEFSLIKNYGTTLDNGSIIVKTTEGYYGLFNMNNIAFDIATQYTFMGLANNTEDGVLLTDRIAVKEYDSWYIIGLDNQKLTAPSSYPIYNYDKTYIYYIDENDNYLIYMYDGSIVLPGVTIKKIETNAKYHILLNGMGNVQIYDYEYKNLIKEYSGFGKTYDYKIEDEKVNIYDGDTLISSFDLEKGE